jgi:RNA polymerase sigma-70 factor (ECF subfamily)
LKDEGRLIRKIQRSGDKASADALVRGYYDEIFRYISRQMYNRADALDITQEVFVSMLGTIRRFDRKRRAFAPSSTVLPPTRPSISSAAPLGKHSKRSH